MKTVEVSFVIRSEYKWGVGMEPHKLEEFHNEITKAFENIGWKKNNPEDWESPTVSQKNQHLYCHPMELSGRVFEENIPVIENLLQHGNTFRYLRTQRM